MNEIQKRVKDVLNSESKAILNAVQHIDVGYEKAIKLMEKTHGRIVFCGMGKAGLVAQKTTATFSSLGISSFFLHPAEALHGDLGAVRPEDIVVCFSNSGESDEMSQLVSVLVKVPVSIISLTGDVNSSLAKIADVVINIGNHEEICHLRLAPTSSTTVMLAIGDALAVIMSERKKTTVEEFAFNHPLGGIGKKLLKINEVMRRDPPAHLPDTPIKEILLSITKKKSGAACIIDTEENVLGIFTDGDLRRHIEDLDDLSGPVEKYMTKKPKTIKENDLCIDAAKIMSSLKIDELPVLSEEGRLLGLLDIQDLLKIGLV